MAVAAKPWLLGEDFDAPPPPPPEPEPEAIEPVFSTEDLARAREQAAIESRAAALAEFEESSRVLARHTLSGIADQIARTRDAADAIAERSADQIARLLCDCFALAFPALSAGHGPDEVTALVRAILPAVRREPKITIRLSPRAAADLRMEIEREDADLAGKIHIVPTDAIEPGDVRISWENGGAAREAGMLWSRIENILAPAGLLSPAPLKEEPALVD